MRTRASLRTRTIRSTIASAGDAANLYNGHSPAIAVGDQFAHDTVTDTYGWTVTVDSDGFPSFASSGDKRTDNFDFYVFDATDETWGTVGTYEITATHEYFGTKVIPIQIKSEGEVWADFLFKEGKK